MNIALIEKKDIFLDCYEKWLGEIFSGVNIFKFLNFYQYKTTNSLEHRLVFIDIDGSDNIDQLLEEIHEHFADKKDTKIILTSFFEETIIENFQTINKANIPGYILKTSRIDEFKMVSDQVLREKNFFQDASQMKKLQDQREKSISDYFDHKRIKMLRSE